MIKKLIQAAALLAACTGAAHASTFEFSYTFIDGQTIGGTLDGTLSGNVVTNVSDVSVSFGTTAFNGPLFVGSWNATTGSPDFTAGSAVFSTDATLNNFWISNSTNPSNTTNELYYTNGAGTTPSGFNHEVNAFFTAADQSNNLSDFDGDGFNGGVGTWSLKPVPLPAALPLILSGLGFFAAARRRRQSAAA